MDICEELESQSTPHVTAIKILIREAKSEERVEIQKWLEHAFTNSGYPRAGHDHLGSMSTYSRST